MFTALSHGTGVTNVSWGFLCVWCLGYNSKMKLWLLFVNPFLKKSKVYIYDWKVLELCQPFL
jgi:hypothetical protein